MQGNQHHHHHRQNTQEYQYSQEELERLNQQYQTAKQQQEYSKGQDLIDDYGSIIKELTDTEDLIYKFRLRLLGMGVDDQQRVVQIGEPLMSRDCVRDFVQQVESIVNQNTHFTFYKANAVEAVIENAAVQIPRWLMLQGAHAPRRHRSAINFMAINLIMASLHKANDGKILRWSKGGFKEQSNVGNQNKPSMMDRLLMRNK